MARRRPLASSDVFINVPFDKQYENLFLALIAGLVGFGLSPRCVLEVPPSMERLRRLHLLIGSCPSSLHDLSRVQISRAGPFRVPRFNMPFELGMATAIALAGDPRRHQWSVLESVAHRAGQSLGDISGYDPHIHDGTVDGMLNVLLDIFGGVPNPPLGEMADLKWVYQGLRRFRATSTGGVYRPNSFKRLVLAAQTVTTEHAASH